MQTSKLFVLALLGLASLAASVHAGTVMTGVVTNQKVRPLATWEVTLTLTSVAPLPALGKNPALRFGSGSKNYTCLLDQTVAGIGTAAAATVTFQPHNPDAHATVVSCDFTKLYDGAYTVYYDYDDNTAQFSDVLATGVEIQSDGLACHADAAAGEALTYCEGSSDDDDGTDWQLGFWIVLGMLILAVLSMCGMGFRFGKGGASFIPMPSVGSSA